MVSFGYRSANLRGALTADFATESAVLGFFDFEFGTLEGCIGARMVILDADIVAAG